MGPTNASSALCLRIAIACSGLGHVHRGIESWASDLAGALTSHGINVTLFGGLTGGGIHALPTLRRDEPVGRNLGRLCRSIGGWRIGLGSAYNFEQITFGLSLLLRIRHDYDIVHVQDPVLAWMMERAYRRGISRAKVVYANGTNEPVAFSRRFSNLQILTPQLARAYEPPVFPASRLHVIPNFIDTTVFSPGDQAAARAALDLPQHATIVLCCAAIRRFHKRIDKLVREFAESGLAGQGVTLVVAGARESDTASIIAEGGALLGEKVRFLVDVPREKMPKLYRAADSFILPSDHEMFGIVVLEAMACGLPVVCNDTESLRYVAGPGALYRDLMRQGGIAAAITSVLQPETKCALARNARPHVQKMFSVTAVVERICQMYQTVAET